MSGSLFHHPERDSGCGVCGGAELTTKVGGTKVGKPRYPFGSKENPHGGPAQYKVVGSVPLDICIHCERHLLDDATDVEKFQDVGRNDPCPCGSGRKFKKCCGG